MKNILLVDDDREVSRSLVGLFDSAKFHITHVDDGAKAEAFLKERVDVDVVLMDVNMPHMNGLELLRRVKIDNKNLPVVMISGQVSAENAIEAIREGAFEYLTKPFEVERLIGVVSRACGLDRVTVQSGPNSTATANSPQRVETDEIVGRSPEIVEIAKLIGQIAKGDASALIFGEPGVGKELVARAIHRNSSRRNGPFLTVNCSSLADTLLESEIFGHEKGAFTGAYLKRTGKFEQANRGTIFFDEIASLSLLMQAKILRALEDSTIERVGGTEKITSDVRIIAATSKSLVQAVKEGSFRVDLFYRLKVASIFMPPLRERKGDIDLLCDHFLQVIAKKLGCAVPILTKEARAALAKYSWPGNVRELENNIHNSMVMAKGSEIGVDDLPITAERDPKIEFDLASMQEDHIELFHKIIDPALPKLLAEHEGRVYNFLNSAMEKALIASALKLYGSNQVRTSEALGISRNTLRDRIARYNLY